MYTRNNRQSSTTLPPDYSGTALSGSIGSPRYVSRQSAASKGMPDSRSASNAKALSNAKNVSNVKAQQDAKATSDTSKAKNASVPNEPQPATSSVISQKRSALTSAASSAASAATSTYIRRPYEKSAPDQKLYSERDIYPPFGTRDNGRSSFPDVSKSAMSNAESGSENSAGNDTESDIDEKTPSEYKSHIEGGNAEISNDENSNTDDRNFIKESDYIPPLTSPNGLGLFAKRELNTDDLLLAGIILMMIGGKETDESDIETALLIAVIFMAGL